MGIFSGTVKTEWLEDEPRKMRLLEEVRYIDNSGKEWVAPSGSIIDGASIPRFFWRVIGSPFVGLYRRSTVIHDVYCVTRSEPHHKVHAMFKEAMESDGVSPGKVSAMYKAVASFGPKWDEVGHDIITYDPLDDEDYG